MTNLALDLREAAQMYPDRCAVRLDDTTLSYALLDELSQKFGGAVKLSAPVKSPVTPRRQEDRFGTVTPVTVSISRSVEVWSKVSPQT